MSHTKSWVRIDDFTKLFKYGGTELGVVTCNLFNTREWTIKPTFEVDIGFRQALRGVKYTSLGSASQALIDLWSIQAAFEAGWETNSWEEDQAQLDMYETWMNSVLNSFSSYCGGSD